MSDDEVDCAQEQRGTLGTKPTLAYTDNDNTSEVSFPKKHVFVLPKGMEVSNMTILSIHHPRHKQTFIVAVDGPSGSICELQEHSRKYGATWFIGTSTVEPDSPLMIGTPIDPVFLALHLLSIPIYNNLTSSDDAIDYLSISNTGPNSNSNGNQEKSPLTRYEDAYNIIGRDKYLCLLPPTSLALIQEAMNYVCDKQVVGNDFYYCLSPDKVKQWLRKKHDALCCSVAFQNFVLRSDVSKDKTIVSTNTVFNNNAHNGLDGGDLEGSAQSFTERPNIVGDSYSKTLSPSLSSHQIETLKRKSAALIAEYLDELIHPTNNSHRRNLMFEATGVDLVEVAKQLEAARKSSSFSGANGGNGSHWDGERCNVNDNIADGNSKKNAAQTSKSHSVKKLEKAGPPKGTPTLLSMFANKS